MDLRFALHKVAAQHKLDPRAAYHLEQLARLEREPAALRYWLARVVALLGAVFGGLGIIFWIAANWDTLGRFGRFALLQGVFLAACAGAFWRPAARAPLGLLALLTIGALFAHLGQTYQTGADAWQLFALWAALALPLCLSVRSDVLWTPWVLVAMSAVSLWALGSSGSRWIVTGAAPQTHALAWSIALGMIGMLSAPLRHVTGAGSWSLRLALTLTTILISSTALVALLLFSHIRSEYALGLCVLGGAAVVLYQPRCHEIYALSAVGLGLDTLLVAGFGQWLLRSGNGIGEFLLLGLAAAGVLALTVRLILGQARRRQLQGGMA